MRPQAWLAVALWAILSGGPAAPAGLVQNGEFTERAAGQAHWPAFWEAPAAAQTLYRAVDDDGFQDKDCLHYRALAGQATGPVRQRVNLRPQTDYVLTAAFKSDGVLRPLVRVLGPNGPLATLLAEPTTTWKAVSVRFPSGAVSQAEIEIWGDERAALHNETRAGFAAVDAVNLYLPEELPAALASAVAFTPPGPNIARGKPYTLSPRPNYSYCTDPEDATQLTDGVYTVGYFWTQKTTVGWTHGNPVIITIDLQRVEPIAGLSYSTAAGVADVHWPNSILILVSDDGQKWAVAGDLVSLATKQGTPPATGYATFRFATDALRTHGRYVSLYVDQMPYTFVDEIEIYRGPEEYLQLAYTQTAEDPQRLFEQKRVHAAVLWRLRTDCQAAQAAIKAASLPAREKERLLAQAAALAAEIEQLPEALPPDFKTILPLNELHARIYALYAPLHRARGLPPLTVWQTCRWDPLGPTQAPTAPPSSTPVLHVRMMRHEIRGEAFNLTNAASEPMTLTLRITGLPGGDNPPYISVREIPFTDTRERQPIAAALPEASRVAGGYRLVIPSGMTRQIWLNISSQGIAPGRYEGRILLSGASLPRPLSVPLALQIYPFDFPARPTIHVGGWDYTNSAGGYDVTRENQAALIRTLMANYVDTPWASAAVQPQGLQFDAEGNLVNEPKFDNWNEWIAKWPGARLYAVFLAVGDSFYGEKMGTPRFQRMIAGWIKAWTQHLEQQELQPEQLVLLLYDEPSEPRGYQIIKAWAQAIKAAEPRVRLFEDPISRDPSAVDPEVWPLLDIICPNLPMFLASSAAFRDFYMGLKQRGKRLWFYSCSGPAKLLDPITYHRSQFWWNIYVGGEGSFYWAFGDEGGGSSWNAYMQKRTQFSPLFLAPDSVTDGKHMAAVREGVEDYEYFVMLRQHISELRQKGRSGAVLDAAEQLSREGPERVIKTITAENLSWATPKDRRLMDEVRVDVLEMLGRLSRL